MPIRFKGVLAVIIASTIFTSTIIALIGCAISPRRVVGGSGSGSSGNSEFNLSVTPTSQVITAGATGTYTVSVQAVNGFSGTVSLSATASNSNVVANFNPPSVDGTGSSTLTIVTSSSTPATTSTISVTGADSSSGQSTSVSVTAVIQAGVATAGTMADKNVPAECVNAAAGSGVQNAAFASSRNSGFSATFAATPSLAPMDAIIGFSSQSPDGQAAFGGLVRFSPAGIIQARDGDTFSASTRVRYSAGETYRFRLVENLPAVTYTVFVTPPGGTETLLGSNLQVPPDQRGAASLNGWGVLVSRPESAALNVCSFALE